MARNTFLFQAVRDETHRDAIKWVLENRPNEILISVAFARAQGVGLFVKELTELSQSVECFVGIRNDITSYQALEVLLRAGVKLFAVDTGSRNLIFHPKVYLSRQEHGGRAVIGSANMTFGGLLNNIEASTVVELSADDDDDRYFIDDVCQSFIYLKSNFPGHVLEISSIDDIDLLLSQGRLVDETIAPKIDSEHSSSKVGTDKIPLMNLHRHTSRPTIKRKLNETIFDSLQASQQQLVALQPSKTDYHLIWQSNELNERDLNIPSGSNTNPTGSMLLKKGAVEGIDQRHFFRDEVFRDAAWVRDEKLQHYERAHAIFHIYTKGVFRGTFTLRLSHNTDTECRSYKQNNSMTNISWGDAREIVAKRDLLDRTMSLYRKDKVPPEYLIEID